MISGVVVRMELQPGLATALERDLRERLRQSIQEAWYHDQFRLIPDGLRTGAILAAYPALAAQKKTLGALRAAMKEHA
ncbi:hypothetical protein [Pseudomonas sp. Marseille-Q5115]|uniref:hypothetical protein n=1 Tax=Pseudomonas sp. Marseille-Q5115 TaxID=2866593 RepID=UPI001CE495C7|nr:hypothetical protein [Pseudomonas sp. Marseille-Q5115]